MSTPLPDGVSHGPHGLRYDSVIYRLVQDGKMIEESHVPAGGYEDTRLGLEVLAGDVGWERVIPGQPAAEEDSDVPVDAAGTPDPDPEQETDESPADVGPDDNDNEVEV